MSSDAELIERFNSGLISQDELARQYFPRIKRIAATVANRLIYDKDDLTQELWLLFVERIAPRFDGTKSLDAYIYEYAKRRSMHLKGEHSRELTLSSFADLPTDDEANEQNGEEKLSSLTGVVSHLDEERIVARIKGQALLDKSAGDAAIVGRLPDISTCLSSETCTSDGIAQGLMDLGFSKTVKGEVLAGTIAKLNSGVEKPAADFGPSQTTKCLSAEQIELRDIRLKSGKTKREFSDIIGIQVASLDAYEYGRTKSVPPEVMTNAREWARNYTDEFTLIKSKFEKMRMSQILAIWINELSFDADDFSTIAIFFETTKTTIKRWMSDESMPQLRKIEYLDSKVRARLKGTTKRPRTTELVALSLA